MKEAIPQSVTRRKKRSVKLSIEEVSKLQEYKKSFDVIEDFAEAMDLNRDTLQRIINTGSGRWDNIDKIRLKLSSLPTANMQ